MSKLDFVGIRVVGEKGRQKRIHPFLFRYKEWVTSSSAIFFLIPDGCYTTGYDGRDLSGVKGESSRWRGLHTVFIAMLAGNR